MKNLPLTLSKASMSASLARQYLCSLLPDELEEVFAPYHCGLIHHIVTAPENRLRHLARLFLGVSLEELTSLDIQAAAQLFVERKMVFTFAELGNIVVRASQKLGAGFNIFTTNNFVASRSRSPNDLLLLVQNDEGVVSLARLVWMSGSTYKVTVSDVGEHDLFEDQAQMMLFRHEGKECLWGAGLEDWMTPDRVVTRQQSLLKFFPTLQLGAPVRPPLATHNSLETSALGKVVFDSVISLAPKHRPGIARFLPTNNGHDEEIYTALMGVPASVYDKDWFAGLVHEKGMAFSVDEFAWILQNLNTIAVTRGSAQSRDLFVHHDGVIYYVKIFDDGKLGVTADLPRNAYCFLHLTRLLLRLPQTNAFWYLQVVVPR